MYGRLIAFLAAASLTLAIVIGAPAPARAAGNGWVTCQSNASIYLYTDITKTELVDAFGVANASTMHRVGGGDYVIQDERGAPGVNVVGLLTGAPYTFWFRDMTNAFAPNPGNVWSGNVMVDWRVTAQSAGVVSDARNQVVNVVHQGEQAVYTFWGRNSGLLLSGNLGIQCPQ